MKLDLLQLAWAAGFFDGEGNTIAAKRCVQLRVGQCDIGPLMRFQAAIGWLGAISGPYERKLPNQRPYYVLVVSNHEHVQATLAMLWRFLSAPKRKQAVIEVRKWKEDRVARASAVMAARLATIPQPKEGI